MIEPVDYCVAWFMYHRTPEGEFHRWELHYDLIEWDEAPSEPPGGWSERCPQCGSTKIDHSRSGSPLWRNPATGVVHRDQHEHGAGAMFSAPWIGRSGPDGRSLAVILPPGGQGDVWYIDGASGDGGYWVRTGEPPMLTVTPSIKTPRYHGHLTAGVLT